jgi:hypothetical protein
LCSSVVATPAREKYNEKIGNIKKKRGRFQDTYSC